MKKLVVSLAGVKPPLVYRPGLNKKEIQSLVERAAGVVNEVAFRQRFQTGTRYRLCLKRGGEQWVEFFCDDVVN